jgi:hypothetical protein
MERDVVSQCAKAERELNLQAALLVIIETPMVRVAG